MLLGKHNAVLNESFLVGFSCYKNTTHPNVRTRHKYMLLEEYI